MRNIPFAFLDEDTIDHINHIAPRRNDRVDGFANLAQVHQSMRGTISWPEIPLLRRMINRVVAILEKMMEMSGPNSIANLERALRSNIRERSSD